MPAATGPSLGYRDQFWLESGTGLVMLQGVTEFDFAEGGTREQVDVTDLNPPGEWRRQYISGFYEDEDFTVTMNYIPLSPTDVLLTAARKTGEELAFRQIVAEQGTLIGDITGVLRVTGYKPDRVSAGAVKTATMTFRVVSVEDMVEFEDDLPEPEE